MTINQTTTTRYLKIDRIGESEFIGQSLDPVDVLYSYLFRNEETLKDRNKFLILFLQGHISASNWDVVKKTLTQSTTFYELHISFLKAMLLMTEKVTEVAEAKDKVLEIYHQRTNK